MCVVTKSHEPETLSAIGLATEDCSLLHGLDGESNGTENGE